jgi:hypothetical protein
MRRNRKSPLDKVTPLQMTSLQGRGSPTKRDSMERGSEDPSSPEILPKAAKVASPTPME